MKVRLRSMRTMRRTSAQKGQKIKDPVVVREDTPRLFKKPCRAVAKQLKSF